jgi:SNF2 family DNA or RNA helicase
MCREPVSLKSLRKALPPVVKKDEDEDEDAMEEDGEAEEEAKRLRFAAHGGKFQFDSKLKKLIVELRRISRDEPGSKSLIFSQFTTTLEWLKIELPKSGFQFRTLSGSMSMTARDKALKDFQGDPPTTIFLLSLRAGAVGINLTEANRVFLMEPALNPALEAQAIGRVHRLGQTKNVEITRFVVKDSIEERIQKIQKAKYGAKAIGEAPEAAGAGAAAGAEAVADAPPLIIPGESDAEMAKRLAEEEQKQLERAQEAGAGGITKEKSEVKQEEFDQM